MNLDTSIIELLRDYFKTTLVSKAYLFFLPHYKALGESAVFILVESELSDESELKLEDMKDDLEILIAVRVSLMFSNGDSKFDELLLNNNGTLIYEVGWSLSFKREQVISSIALSNSKNGSMGFDN